MAKSTTLKVRDRMEAFTTRVCDRYVNTRSFRVVRIIDRYQFLMQRMVAAYYDLCVDYDQEMRGRKAVEEFNLSLQTLRYIRSWFWFKALGVEIPIDKLGDESN